MPDTQIHPLGTVTAPGDFTIPGSAKLKLKGVYASFNGAAAATSFVPLVRFISDAGSVALEAPADNTIAAGGSADASWFPRVASKPAAAPAGTGLSWAYIDQSGHTLCAAGANTFLSATVGRFYTNASSLYGTATDAGGRVGISLLANGHYFSLITVGPFGTPAAGSVYDVVSSGGGDVAGFEMSPSALVFPTGGVADVGRVQAGEIMTVGGGTSPPTGPIIAEIINSGSHDVQLSVFGHLLVQLDSDPTELL